MEQVKKFEDAMEAFAASFARNSQLPSLRDRLEVEMPDQPYQLMAVYQRNRHKGVKGEDWPDRPESASALSRYPNILAELDASGWWLDRIARYANVSMEIMAAAMEDYGELSWDELKGLKRCFKCKLDYLAAPILSMVDPATNKGKVRLQRLKDLVQQTEGMDRFFYQTYSSDILPKLENGKSVTYAAYRWARNNLQDVLDGIAREESRQRHVRTVDILPAQAPDEIQVDLSTRLQQARKRDNARKLENRLAEIRKCVDDTRLDTFSGEDLFALADFSQRDLYGALILAFRYGCAVGCQTAGEVATA